MLSASRVPALPLANSVTNHPPAPAESYKLLRRQGVTWIIFTSGMGKTPINDMKDELIRGGCIGREPIYRNGSFEVHELLVGPGGAPASSSAGVATSRPEGKMN